MKTAKAIRDAYNTAKNHYERLAEDVRAVLEGEVVSRGWFFIFRVKELESFALKIETGRVPDPLRMEDFFACTIVVPTLLHVSDAEAFLESMYDVDSRRPEDDDKTHKRASEFVFDDLRMYLKRRPNSTGRNDDLDGLVFEAQVKTVLQHAWGIASHDLIYKTDNVSWPKARIAYQVKAMLEHAEVAIAEAEKLANSQAIAKSDKETSDILAVISIIKNVWSAERLPRDVKRLAESMLKVMRVCQVKLADLAAILNNEIARFGMLPSNLSPYAFFIQALANSPDYDLKASLKGSRQSNFRLLIHGDMDLPKWMGEKNERIISI